MFSKILKRIFVCGMVVSALLVFSAGAIFAQIAEGSVSEGSASELLAPEVSSSVENVEVFVGDAISFSVSVVADSGVKIAPLTIEKKLGDFEIQDIKFSGPKMLDDGKVRYRTAVKLWALEIGEHEIPSLAVYFSAEGLAVDSIFTSAITVTVSSVVGEGADSAAIKPLREPLEDPLELKKPLLQSPTFWGSVIVALLLLGALIWWLVLRSRKEEEKWVDPRAPWEIALDRLAELQNQPLLEQGLFKMYYSELTDTLREYLGSALNRHTLDMTTAELLAILEADSVTIVYRSGVASVLAQADMVKFAKATPKTERPSADFESVYSLIKSIRDDLTERERKAEELRKELLEQEKKSKGVDVEASSSGEEVSGDKAEVSSEDTTIVKEPSDV